MAAALRLAGIAIQWFVAAYITNEVTDVVAPKVDHALGNQGLNEPAAIVGQQHTTKKPLLERLVSTATTVAISATLFFATTYLLSKLLRK